MARQLRRNPQMFRFEAVMQIPVHLRARISALGELSRPLGEARAAELAGELAREIANDVTHNRNPDPTINAWIRRLAAEILEKNGSLETRSSKFKGHRPLSDVLPEVFARKP